jgi:5-methylcytosine-specific restriction endonuclease McrA
VGKSNQLLAALLLHLAEVEARGVHRTRRCASLYTYCIYELRFSEDAAARRSAAARFVKQFPALLDAVADGELHLTGLLMIGPHLTPENQTEVLGRARFRTKKELAKLVRELNPLPRIPDRLEPLGPEPMQALRKPTWLEFVESLSPPVRELPAGEHPRDWANDGTDEGEVKEEELPVGPVPADLPPVTGPQQYQVQFSTVEEHVQLVERAKALMARQRPGVSLGELHLEAMKLLVASLEKRKFAVGATSKPRQRKADRQPHHTATRPEPHQTDAHLEPRQTDTQLEPRQRNTQRQPRDTDRQPRQRDTHLEPSQTDAHLEPPPTDAQIAASASFDSSQKRSRHIPTALRREVYERDAGRCTYVDVRGERCCETRFLELHHLHPFAKGGPHDASNLAVRCMAHNRLAAEQDFGQELIAERREGARHEAQSRQIVETE